MVDSITEEILNASLAGVVKQMQEALFRTGFSTIIRESHDASCAILTAKGDVAAQYIVLPLHLGVFPVSIKAVLEVYPPHAISDGDAFLVNHPYIGGSPHAPDMCVIIPVFIERKKDGTYKIEFYNEISSTNFKNKIDLTQKLNSILEEMIKKNPYEWIWTHNRWK